MHSYECWSRKNSLQFGLSLGRRIYSVEVPIAKVLGVENCTPRIITLMAMASQESFMWIGSIRAEILLKNFSKENPCLPELLRNRPLDRPNAARAKSEAESF